MQNHLWRLMCSVLALPQCQYADPVLLRVKRETAVNDLDTAVNDLDQAAMDSTLESPV
jgi:hypothetical protein